MSSMRDHSTAIDQGDVPVTRSQILTGERNTASRRRSRVPLKNLAWVGPEGQDPE